jgi:WD40 repeat protein
MPTIEAKRLDTTTAYPRPGSDQYDYVEVQAAAFAPDGRLAVADEEGMVWLYDTSGGRLREIGSGSLAVEPNSAWEACTVTWTAQHRLLGCLTIQRTGSRPMVHPESLESWLVVLDAETLKPVDSWRISTEGADVVQTMSWAPRGAVYALLNGRSQPELRRQSDSSITATLPRWSDPMRWDIVQCLDLRADGTQLATAATCAHVQVWPIYRGIPGEPSRLVHPPRIDPVPADLEGSDHIWCEDIVWSPDGGRLAWSDMIGGVWWWPAQEAAQGGAPPMAQGLGHPYCEGRNDFARWFLKVEYLAWSWDSQSLMGVDNRGTVRCWHPGTDPGYASIERKGTGAREWRPAWGPNGLIAVPGEPGVVELFSLRT